MIRHHPGDDLLLPLAAGRLQPAQALLVAVHLERCVECRARLHTLQALGGALLEESDPLPVETDAWARTLERIDAPAVVPAAVSATSPGRSSLALPGDTPWPVGLRGCRVTRWRWMGPGLRLSRVTLPCDPDAALFLLRIGEGRSLPRHTHGGTELTQVLCGSFDDGRERFGPGDFDATDESVHHQPVVDHHAECVCLAYVAAPLRFDGRVASLLGSWIGM
jgi:putative transcriptional regulator